MCKQHDAGGAFGKREIAEQSPSNFYLLSCSGGGHPLSVV